MESFKDLRAFSPIKDSTDEVQFTDLLKHIYNRHKVCIFTCKPSRIPTPNTECGPHDGHGRG